MDILSLIGVKSAEELGKLIQDGTQELVREKAEQLLDRLMEAELLEFLADAANAVPGEFRNGYYTRLIKTSYGPMELRVPRDRLGCFRTKLLKPYQRTTDELCDLIRDLYVKRGMTANEISDFLLDRYGMEISREKIRTEVNTVLGDAVSFNSRCIPDCAVVFLDGTYVPIKRREPGSSRVEKECVMIALGITKNWISEINRKKQYFVCRSMNGLFPWEKRRKTLPSLKSHSDALQYQCVLIFGITGPVGQHTEQNMGAFVAARNLGGFLGKAAIFLFRDVFRYF